MKKELIKKTISVDFDGTLVLNIYPYIGDTIDHSIRVLKRLQDAGHTLILLTMREGNLLDDAEEWLLNHGIEVKYVNCNPEFETGSRKVYSQLILDDHSFIPLIHDTEIHPKPFVNWLEVEILLEQKGYL